MLKKISFLICLVLIGSLSVVSIIQMYSSHNTYQLPFKEENLTAERVDLSDAINAQYMDIKLEKEVDIEVVAKTEDVLDIYTLKLDDKCYIDKGKTVPPNTKILKIGGKNYITAGKTRCINIESKDGNKYVTLLDYSKFRIKALFPVNMITDDLYGGKFQFKIAGEIVNATVDYIDYVCEDGYVAVYFFYESKENDLICGMRGTYSHPLETAENVLGLPLTHIIYDEYKELYYVELVRDNRIVTQMVTLGIVGNDFAQILSGIDVGDQVVYPTNTTSLWDHLNNK